MMVEKSLKNLPGSLNFSIAQPFAHCMKWRSLVNTAIVFSKKKIWIEASFQELADAGDTQRFNDTKEVFLIRVRFARKKNSG